MRRGRDMRRYELLKAIAFIGNFPDPELVKDEFNRLLQDIENWAYENYT